MVQYRNLNKDAIHTIIVDDEKKGIDALIWKLKNIHPPHEVHHSFTSPEKALLYCISKKVDLIFLDIDMPKMNGLEFIGALNQLNNTPRVIFVTGHEEFILDALRKEAFDYLLKPLDINELQRALDRFNEQFVSVNQVRYQDKTKKKIALPTSENILIFNAEDIIYCASESNYTSVYTEDEKKLLLAKTLGKVELLLDDSFLRIHHSYIVNLDKISSYQRGVGGSVTLHNGTVLPVSKNRKEDLMHRMGM